MATEQVEAVQPDAAGVEDVEETVGDKGYII